MRWLIVGDDLTGAADCAIAFAIRGTESVVTWGNAAPALAAPVLSVDADSRGLPEARAVQRQLAVQAAYWRPGVRLYKKIDSTLRGQPAAELAAQLAALREGGGRPPLAVVAPAFPATGRVTVGGRVLLNGVPLERTPLWERDHTYANASIPDVLASAGLAAETIVVDEVRAGPDAVHARLADAAHRGLAAVVCDCVSEADLAVIAAASLRLPSAAWAGSGGLAHAIAAHQQPAARRPPNLPPHHGRVLMVVGSLAEISGIQVRTVVDSGLARHVSIDPAALLAGPATSAWRAAQGSLKKALGAGGDILLEVATTPSPDLARGPEIAARLAALAAPFAADIGALIVTGGETACALLSGFGIHGIRLIDEVEPGVPLGMTLGARSFPVVTKAGAFGNAQTLCRCLARLGSPDSSKESGMTRPIIAITMGDPAGIGPEIIMRALGHKEVYATCRPLVVGDARRLRRAGTIVSSNLKLHAVGNGDAAFEFGTVDVVDLPTVPADLRFGEVSAAAGEAAYRAIERACQLVLAGEAAAMCTAPISKEALHAAGHRYPGHTELLAELTHTPEVSMMLSAPKLRVIHVTTHIGLIDAIARIDPGLVERTIARGRDTLVKAGIDNPRIGVCAINPHAGENGLFGRGEEAEKIDPAIAACKARGWAVEGPLPADTLFYRASRGDFDLVVAMYHDQGHGPVKVLGIEAGVNITVGLPVVRTSVDHGTAFDIAGTGTADERSLIEAIRQAVALAPRCADAAGRRSAAHAQSGRGAMA